MLSELAVAYLVLGGVGAGCMGVCAVVDLVSVREPFGDAEYVQGPAIRSEARMIDLSFAGGFAMLGIGCACLILDLGRTERVISLFIHPTLSWMTIGAYSVAILLMLGAFLAIVRFLYLPEFRRSVIVACEIAAIVLGIVVMVYTGMLLGTLRGMALWVSPWLPALFVASSVSGGIAAVVLSSIFVPGSESVGHLLHGLTTADMLVILVEAILAAMFLVGAGTGPNPGAISGFERLIDGSQAKLWWIGFVGCGMIVPFVIEVIYHFTGGIDSDISTKAIILGAALVLVGVVCMRASIVNAGEHRVLELQDPLPVEMVVGNPEESDRSWVSLEDERVLYEAKE